MLKAEEGWTSKVLEAIDDSSNSNMSNYGDEFSFLSHKFNKMLKKDEELGYERR